MSRAIKHSVLSGISIVLLVSSFIASANPIDLDAAFVDVRVDIENAILNKGFVIDFNGNISRMLANTSEVAENPKPVYVDAQFWQFCSSKTTRQMVELNPSNLMYCPFVIYAYETVDKPGQVTVGYRPLSANENDSHFKMVSDINNMLDAIIADVK